MDDRREILTERRLPESIGLDRMDTEQAIAVMNRQDAVAVAAVTAVRAEVARAVDLVVDRLSRGGRLIYVGAGTSGRLGVLDASECPPTFRSDPGQVVGLIAGGPSAMFAAKEGAEDSPDGGAAAVDEINAGPLDVVFGIAAGGTTPFVHGALRRAISVGAGTVFLSCVENVPKEPPVDVVIRPLTGPEVITGSTRLKAGTATKLVLNQITTVAMVRLGKVYDNWMVDLRATNAKLRDRAIRILQDVLTIDRSDAIGLLDQADGHVKTAIVMARRGVDRSTAVEMLDRARGRLRDVIRAES